MVKGLAADGSTGGSSIKIKGLTETLTRLRALGVETDDLKTLNFEAGVIIAKKVNIPADEGNMAMTLKVASQAKKAKVSVGQKTKGWYSTFIEYGTKHIKANPFLMIAADKSEDEIVDHYDQGLAQLINKYNLGEG